MVVLLAAFAGDDDDVDGGVRVIARVGACANMPRARNQSTRDDGDGGGGDM